MIETETVNWRWLPKDRNIPEQIFARSSDMRRLQQKSGDLSTHLAWNAKGFIRLADSRVPRHSALATSVLLAGGEQRELRSALPVYTKRAIRNSREEAKVRYCHYELKLSHYFDKFGM